MKLVVFEFGLKASLDFEMCREDIVELRTPMAFIFFPLTCSPIVLIFASLGLCREKAEQTIWNRLHQLKALKTKRPRSRVPLRIGILGIHSFADFSILRLGILEFFL